MDRWLLENAVRQIRVDFTAVARRIGADPATLQACMDRPETQKRVEQLAREGSEMKLKGTPAFVLDGERVSSRNLRAKLEEKL